MIPDGITPYCAWGGPPTDYEIREGVNGTLYTFHLPTNRAIPNVVAGGVKNPSPNPDLSSLSNAARLATGLGVANLGVGLLNMGVGVYNAHQIGQVRKTLDTVEGRIVDSQRQLERVHEDIHNLGRSVAEGFDTIETTLREQTVALGILAHGQSILVDRIAWLREEIQTRFRDTHEAILSAEARDLRRNLKFLGEECLRHYRSLIAKLSEGQMPAPGECSRVIGAAERFRAWTVTCLELAPQGHERRLPLMVSKVLATRIAADARVLETPGFQDPSEDLRRIRDEIAIEAGNLCEGRTLFELGEPLNEVLAGYVFLRRGLNVEYGISEQNTFPLWPLGSRLWDDGLSIIRELRETEGDAGLEDSSELPLPSLAERRWLRAFYGSGDHTGLPETVNLRTVLDVVGIPNNITRIPKSSIEGLKLLALPNKREAYAAHIQSEFCLSNKPHIVSSSRAT